MPPYPFPIWRGCYATLQDAPGRGAGFASARWQEQCRAELDACLAPPSLAPPASRLLTRIPSALLPLTAGLATHRPVRILDIGGGMGATYCQLRAALGAAAIAAYDVVEAESLCTAAAPYFASDPVIRLLPDMPSQGSYDIIYCGSSLQYIEPWRELLDQLAQRAIPWLILDDVPLQEGATYATLQRWYDAELPCWMFGRRDLEAALHRAGWHLREQRIAGLFTDPAIRPQCCADIPPPQQPHYWWHVLCSGSKTPGKDR